MPRGPFALLFDHRTYRIYWLGQAVSLTGSWMQQVAQGWVIVSLTSSTAAIATVSFVASLPMLALSMHGGVIADRHDRRRILIVTQLGFAALAFAYAALVASGLLTLPWVYAMALMLATVMAYDFPAVQALVPDLVPHERIPDAVALGQTLMHGTRLVGPAIAGILMAATSPAGAFVANGLSFFAVIFSLVIITVPPREKKPRGRGAGGLREAFRYLGEHPTVRALIGYTALCTSFMFPLFVVFGAVFVRDILGGGARHFGLFMSASGLGAMTGALMLLRVPGPWRGAAIIAASVAAAACVAVQSFSTSVAAAIAVQTFVAFFVSIGLGLSSTIVQITVPTELRGRILGLNGLMFTGLMPSAALLLGALGEAIGLRLVMRLCAGVFVLLAVPWLLRAGLGKRMEHRADRVVA